MRDSAWLRLMGGVVLPLFGAALAAGSENPDRYRNDLQPLIENLVRRQQIPGLAMAVVEGERVVYARGFGVGDLRKPGAVSPRSLFHMASITKTFVATAIMQLVESGKVRLEAPVVTYLPYFRLADARYKDVTVGQMVTHTSGMPDVADYEWDKPQYDDGALERYVRGLQGARLEFAPGSAYQYSNMAYEVLGDVIAKASGQSFESYVDDHILAPLRMGDSTLLVKRANPGLMTWGHELDSRGQPFASKVYPYNRTHSPSSDLHSSVTDMSRWAMANLNRGDLGGRRILAESTYDLMWRAAREIGSSGPDARREAIGISWFLGEHRGRRIVSHGGGDTGYVTDLVLIPENRIAVVWMANCDWIDHDELSRAALDVAIGRKPEPLTIRRGTSRVLESTFKERGLEAALEQYQDLKKRQSDLYSFEEGELNNVGYFLLRAGRASDAVRVFQLNVQAYPSSANAQDSLAEAYEAAGDGKQAMVHYERALQLDPKLSHASGALERLRKAGS